jgi:hypothetical protein
LVHHAGDEVEDFVEEEGGVDDVPVEVEGGGREERKKRKFKLVFLLRTFKRRRKEEDIQKETKEDEMRHRSLK